MKFDVENQVCVAQAFTGVAVSLHSYQKQSAAQDLSIGRKMGALFLPTVAADCTSVLLEVVEADVTALTTNVTALATRTVLAADLAMGKQVFLAFPPGSMSRLHLGVRVTPTGGNATVSLDAYIVPEDEVATYKSFPKIVSATV